jgi:hypothetical protein
MLSKCIKLIHVPYITKFIPFGHLEAIRSINSDIPYDTQLIEISISLNL